MNAPTFSLRSAARQRGVALLVSLMFLIVLTVLGLAAMRTTTLEEKMAGGSRDYNIALQAAEAALRDAEVDLRAGGIPAPGRLITIASFPPLGTDACGITGLCVVNSDYTQLYGNTTFVSWSGSSTTVYGVYTGAKPISGVSQAPRYVMEIVRFHDGGYQAPGVFTNPSYYIRVTARGWGASSQTVVTLQALYLMPLAPT